MDEARRFLRYITPGLVFLVETLVLIWILLPNWPQEHIFKLKKDAGIGFILATIIGSGGLGFVFSVVHHTLLWGCRWIWLTGPVDHRNLIARLRSRNIIRIFDIQSGNVMLLDYWTPDKFEAWAIVTALWHERIVTSKKNSIKIKSAEPRADSLSNLYHSLGAARIASVFAVIAALSVASHVADFSPDMSDVIRFIIAIMIATTLVVFHFYAFCRAGLAAQKVIEEVLTDALVDETLIGPVKTYFHPTDSDQTNAATSGRCF